MRSCKREVVTPVKHLQEFLDNHQMIMAVLPACNEEIAFSAGSHRELLRMACKDFEGIVKLKVAGFSYTVALLQAAHFDCTSLVPNHTLDVSVSRK
jgi:hypothetical protein